MAITYQARVADPCQPPHFGRVTRGWEAKGQAYFITFCAQTVLVAMRLPGSSWSHSHPTQPIACRRKIKVDVLGGALQLNDREDAIFPQHLFLNLPGLRSYDIGCEVSPWPSRLQAESRRFFGRHKDGIMPLAPIGKVGYYRGVVLDEV